MPASLVDSQRRPLIRTCLPDKNNMSTHDDRENFPHCRHSSLLQQSGWPGPRRWQPALQADHSACAAGHRAPGRRLEITEDEFWHAIDYLNRLGGRNEAGLLAAGLGIEHFLDLLQDAKDAEAGLSGGTPRTIEGPLYVAGAPLAQGEARMDDGTDPAW